MALKVFNTLSGQEEVFAPLEDMKVGMYVCGPTVYDHSHLGHARAYIAYDVIYRYLKYSGYEVTYVRNITDIDDKIITRAQNENTTFDQIAKTYENSYHDDMDALGLLRPNIKPRATETIPEMLDMIEELIKNGHAYESQGDVYFAVRTLAGYGKLSKRNLDDLKAGARVEVGELKRDPLDFALWKSSKPGEPSWESPWGKGRPAWHIECSAMSKKFLGDTIDIHAGGRDLIFPHHENEIAQSEGANKKPFAKYWLHNGFLTLSAEKMSKSVGNILKIKDVLAKYHPEVLKLYFYSTHYRNPMDFTEQGLEEASKALSKIYRVCLTVPAKESSISEAYSVRFTEAMDQDFNTAKCVGVFFDMVRDINRLMQKEQTFEESQYLTGSLKKMANVVGLLQHDPRDYFDFQAKKMGVDVVYVEGLISQRHEARRLKNFSRADEIRNELTRKNIQLEDGPDGTTWKVG